MTPLKGGVKSISELGGRLQLTFAQSVYIIYQMASIVNYNWRACLLVRGFGQV